MDLLSYVGLKVKIILANNYYYVGKVLDADDKFIKLLDFKGKHVTISKDAILSLQEVL
jgi:RNase P/RNase MRP subunit p29